jgi:hypothetical protein
VEDRIQAAVAELIAAIREEVRNTEQGEINCTSARTEKDYPREQYSFGFSVQKPLAETQEK